MYARVLAAKKGEAIMQPSGIIQSLLNYMTDLLRWWVVVAPWEQAIRVRLGKRVALLHAGVWLRIPLVDKIYIQSIRLRVVSTHTQTLTSLDGKLLTIGATVGYSVKDILKLYQTMHFPEQTIQNIVAARIAQCVAANPAANLTPAALGAVASNGIDFSQWGLEAGQVQVTDFAFVRGYRLIMDGRAVYFGSGPDMNTPQA